MGEILGLGLSHYPNLRGTDDAMASILRRSLQRPDVPDSWKDVKSWPQAMQDEWGDDEGRTAAPKHRAEFVKIIIPKENEKDIEDIPKSLVKQIEFHVVEHLDEVLHHALELDDLDEFFARARKLVDAGPPMPLEPKYAESETNTRTH